MGKNLFLTLLLSTSLSGAVTNINVASLTNTVTKNGTNVLTGTNRFLLNPLIGNDAIYVINPGANVQFQTNTVVSGGYTNFEITILSTASGGSNNFYVNGVNINNGNLTNSLSIIVVASGSNIFFYPTNVVDNQISNLSAVKLTVGRIPSGRYRGSDTNSILIGTPAGTHGVNSVTVGDSLVNSAPNGINIGTLGSAVTGTNAVLVGAGSVSGYNAGGFGIVDSVAGDYAFGFGFGVDANYIDSYVFGRSAASTKTNQFVFGKNGVEVFIPGSAIVTNDVSSYTGHFTNGIFLSGTNIYIMIPGTNITFTTNGNVISINGNAGGGVGSPGGTSSQGQFNNAGVLGGIPQLLWDGTRTIFTNGTGPYFIFRQTNSNAGSRVFGIKQLDSGLSFFAFADDLSSSNVLFDIAGSSTGGPTTLAQAYGDFYVKSNLNVSGKITVSGSILHSGPVTNNSKSLFNGPIQFAEGVANNINTLIDANLTNNYVVTLTNNTTLVLTNFNNGNKVDLWVVQNSVGGWTLGFTPITNLICINGLLQTNSVPQPTTNASYMSHYVVSMSSGTNRLEGPGTTSSTNLVDISNLTPINGQAVGWASGRLTNIVASASGNVNFTDLNINQFNTNNGTYKIAIKSGALETNISVFGPRNFPLAADSTNADWAVGVPLRQGITVSASFTNKFQNTPPSVGDEIIYTVNNIGLTNITVFFGAGGNEITNNTYINGNSSALTSFDVPPGISTFEWGYNGLKYFFKYTGPPVIFTSYAAGTAYTTTATPALTDFGTTDPIITFTASGTYKIFAGAGVKYNAATYGTAQTVTVKLRKTSGSAADITNATKTVELPVLTAFTGGDQLQIPLVTFTVATGDVVQLWSSVSALPSAGSVIVDSAEIFAERLY